MIHDSSLHRRRSVRLKGYDYGQAGAYFVTVCTHQRNCTLGRIVGSEVLLSKAGDIVNQVWLNLATQNNKLRLDAFVVMPNHVHGVVFIKDGPWLPPKRRGEAFGNRADLLSGARRPNASPLHQPTPSHPIGTKQGSLGAIIQNFKSVSARKVNQATGMSAGPLWQRNYYEHIVRNDEDLYNIRQYIADNPAKWQEDTLNPLRRPNQ